MSNKKVVGVVLDEAMHSKFKSAAAANGATMTALIRHWIELYILNFERRNDSDRGGAIGDDRVELRRGT